jgi:hypothetical protein
VIFAAAEATMAMYFNADDELKERAETQSNALARDLAKQSLTWKAAEASAIATRVTAETAAALHKALVG